MASESYASNLVIRKNTFFAPSYIVLTKLTFQYHYFDVLGTAYYLPSFFMYLSRLWKQSCQLIFSTYLCKICTYFVYISPNSNGKKFEKGIDSIQQTRTMRWIFCLRAQNSCGKSGI